VLVPQPSDSPNDPLNWPLWKKDFILFIVGMSAAVVGAYGPMLGPGFVPISEQLGITVEVLSQATAWLILTLGLCVFIMNPIAKIYGKRPVYVFASIVLFIVSIWGGVADTYGSFLGSKSSLSLNGYEFSTDIFPQAESWVRWAWLRTKSLCKPRFQTCISYISGVLGLLCGIFSCSVGSVELVLSQAT
jgi:hypothetical protein